MLYFTFCVLNLFKFGVQTNNATSCCIVGGLDITQEAKFN